MITKSKKAPLTAFYVKYDTEGKQFIRQLRAHLNKGEYTIRLQGRNEDRSAIRYNAQSRVPLINSSYVAVYLNGKTTERIERDKLTALYRRGAPVVKYVDRWIEVPAAHKVYWSQLWSDFKQLCGF